MSMKNTKRGFTLIELLVVIAIIGILSGVVLASLNTARERARNATRISDLKQIALTLELANDAAGVYPSPILPAETALTVPNSLVGDGYFTVEPTDPSTDADYSYALDGTGYCLGTALEGTTPAVPRNDSPDCYTAATDPLNSIPGINYAIRP
jgi:prepilin-type N-terminal cleavage/methylation domain-containing protein